MLLFRCVWKSKSGEISLPFLSSGFRETDEGRIWGVRNSKTTGNRSIQTSNDCHNIVAGLGWIRNAEKLGKLSGSWNQDDVNQIPHSESISSNDASLVDFGQSLADMDGTKGFSFTEVHCLCSGRSNVSCCHFSSDGKLLASAEQDKKVTIWNMDAFDSQTTSEEHTLLITDICFKPNSTIFATSSLDRTVNIWSATQPSRLISQLEHKKEVMSCDFHPKREELLISCDDFGKIWWWNINDSDCIHTSEHLHITCVRIQPRVGDYIAAASGKAISIIDVQTDKLKILLKGHTKDVRSICWHDSGGYMASISEDCACIWSASLDWKCISRRKFSDNRFQSCTFHPKHPLHLIIGGYQTLELWGSAEGKTLTSQDHDGLVATLSSSPSSGMVASASNDHQNVKLWK